MFIKKHIPNTVTLLNLTVGSIAVLFAINGWQIYAVILIFIAALFDFLDGFLARLLKAYSPLGKELDSLADLVSFGLAPSFLLYHRYNEVLSPFINSGGNSILFQAATLIPLFITLASALRLAKFNNDENQKENFIGLPTPANALLIASLIIFTTYSTFLNTIVANPFTIPIFSIVLSYLLISKISMFSMKMKSLTYKDNRSRFIFLALIIISAALCLIFSTHLSLWISSVFIIYIVMNLIIHFTKRKYNK